MAITTSIHVLVVEDDSSVRKSLVNRLDSEGYTVTAARNDSEALELLGADDANSDTESQSHGGIDLVLLDNILPDTNGIELLQEIRKTTTRIELPVIVVTEEDTPQAVVEALQAEANDYITKPIHFEVLLARMATHLDLRASHRSLHESHRSLVNAARMESVTQLAAGVAHEIRNPLAQIQMCLDGIRPTIPAENQFGQEMAGMLGEAVVCAEAIVSALIGQSEEAKLDLLEQDLNGFIASTLEIMRDDLRTGHTHIMFERGDPSPIGFISTDECRQVLMNIILNSIEAMPGGGVINIKTGYRTPEDLPVDEGSRVGARVRNGERCAYIDVEDGGPGIDESELERIFDPFFTSKTTGRSSGQGLGLTVCKKLVDLHGGQVILRNLPNRAGLRASLLLRCNETAML